MIEGILSALASALALNLANLIGSDRSLDKWERMGADARERMHESGCTRVDARADARVDARADAREWMQESGFKSYDLSEPIRCAKFRAREGMRERGCESGCKSGCKSGCESRCDSRCTR